MKLFSLPNPIYTNSLTKTIRAEPARQKVGTTQMTKIERTAHFFDSMSKLGFSYSEAQSLRRIEMTLHRWAQAECNGEIERDEVYGFPCRISRAYITGATDKRSSWRVPDREAGAIKRLANIMLNHPELWSYHQTDPRGCALYIGRKDGLRDGEAEKLDSYYSMRGFGVCI